MVRQQLGPGAIEGAIDRLAEIRPQILEIACVNADESLRVLTRLPVQLGIAYALVCSPQRVVQRMATVKQESLHMVRKRGLHVELLASRALPKQKRQRKRDGRALAGNRLCRWQMVPR